MPIFDVVLDAQNEVTPEITFKDTARHSAVTGADIWFQAIRESGSTQITLNIEYCIPGPNGEKTWHEVASFDVGTAAGASEMARRNDFSAGLLCRVLYETNSTDQIRVRAASPSDPFAP